MKQHSISICVCTYKRTEMLKNLLTKIIVLNDFSILNPEVIIVDNDAEGSAEIIVKNFKKRNKIHVKYIIQPIKNISIARNTAIKNSNCEYIAFIDDDEFPDKKWISYHLNIIEKFDATGSLGPFISVYNTLPPKWLEKSGLANRDRYKTGTFLSWNQTRTGNAIIKRNKLPLPEKCFDREFGVLGGEDVMFFKKRIEEGLSFVWCDEAIVYEIQPLERLKIRYYFKRALIRGTSSHDYLKKGLYFLRIKVFLKDLLAVFLYFTILPITIFFGFHKVIIVIEKLLNHFSRILAAFGIIVIKNR